MDDVKLASGGKKRGGRGGGREKRVRASSGKRKKNWLDGKKGEKGLHQFPAEKRTIVLSTRRRRNDRGKKMEEGVKKRKRATKGEDSIPARRGKK